MLTPTARSILLSGGAAYMGQAAPVPAWAVGAPLNAWIEIPGTSGAGGATVVSYSGWAFVPPGRFVIAAPGGHTDGRKNNVVDINTLLDAPGWSELCPESPTHTDETAYQPDGKPSSCHTYQSEMWVPELNRVMRFGAYSVNYSGNTSFMTVDGFNLDTNTWDAAGTYANCPVHGTAKGGGKVLSLLGTQMMDCATQVWSAVSVGSVVKPRSPWVWDDSRNHFFGLCFGDNQGTDLGLGVVAAKIVGNTMSQITFNSSAALSQFITEVPLYAAMEKDPINDCYLFYCGSSAGAEGRIYKITPNGTSVWDMTLFSYGSGGITPVNPPASGIQNKFTYVPALKGIVMMADKLFAPSNLYYMRLL